jgi:hypothetical protein
MAGRILTYLLSILLPISPMLCGQCRGSARCQSADSECCRALTAADTLPQPETCCPANCPGFNEALSQSGTGAQRDVGPKSSPPTGPQRPQLPCRHEHCRSAICGQSAVTLRRVDWSVQEAQEPMGLMLQLWSLKASLRELDQESIFSLASNLVWEVNVGPSGRAARIAFCSWLI